MAATNGDAMGFVQASQHFQQFPGGGGIQIGAGFVRSSSTGSGDDGPRNGHPLLLAAGKLTRARSAMSSMPSAPALARAAGALGRADALQLHDELDVFPRGQHRDQIVGLKHETHLVETQIRQLAFD